MRRVYERLRLGSIRPTGWLLRQLVEDLDQGFVACLDSLTERAAHDLFARRIESSSEQIAWWDAETRGNWLWGYGWMAWLSGQAEHQARVDELLGALIATQDADGYLGIYSPQARYQHGDGENGELWAQSRALLALLTVYEFTGRSEWLDAIRRAADRTMQAYGEGCSYFRSSGDPLAQMTGMMHGLCYIDVMEWLFDLTGDTRYRDFGAWLYDDFCALPVPFANDDLSTRSLLNHERPFGGHAVHTAEHLRALAWAWAVSERDDLAQAMRAAQTKFARYTLPSGALIGDEGLHGMPLPEMGYEYCTTTEYLASLISVMLQTGLGADAIERLAFNAGQGARLASGQAVAYLSQDTRLDAHASRADSYSHFHRGGGRFKFSPTHEDIACCCNPNAARLLPQYVSAQWALEPDQSGLMATLYGACELETVIAGTQITIVESTDYPFEDVIRFEVRPAQPAAFRLGFRVPAWTGSWRLQLNGEDVPGIEPQGGLLALERTWQLGDWVSLTLVPCIEVDAYPNGEFAVLRGPLQYVLPIESERRILKPYAGSSLVDFELTPADLEQAYRPVILRGDAPDFGLQYETASPGDRDWHTASVRLVGDGVTLVPMGCAMLRRAAFPMIGRGE